jgi:hypothetical protein
MFAGVNKVVRRGLTKMVFERVEGPNHVAFLE